MAKYAILQFAEAPADPAELTPDELAAYRRHADEVDQGTLGASMVAAFALHPSTTATSVRGDAVTDGPFLEAKEVVAGFYVIEAPDLDTALEVAKRNPATQQGGGVEVRPVISSTED
jgi:hypothetical protein